MSFQKNVVFYCMVLSDLDRIQQILEQVNDPEIPVLTIADLGILRNVQIENGQVIVTITPTYSGCPAMYVIEDDIKAALRENGIENVVVNQVLSPVWTTDWMTQAGREKLEKYGIAPPVKTTTNKKTLFGEAPIVKCPLCKSTNTELKSQFGSTACKALYVCNDCKEPFDYFKCL